MGISEIVEFLKSRFLVIGAMRVSKEDGDVTEQFGDINPKMSDIGAFLGSAGEVIFRKLQMENPKHANFNVEGLNIILINEGAYFVLFSMNGIVNVNEFYDAYNAVLNPAKESESVLSKSEETGADNIDIDMDSNTDDLMSFAQNTEVNRLGEIERKLLTAKILQLNYLAEEFSQNGDKNKWTSFVSDILGGMDDMSKAITVSDKISVNEIVSVEISRENIQAKSKTIIDGLCKKAVDEYGAAEAKRMVQNVITKLNKK